MNTSTANAKLVTWDRNKSEQRVRCNLKELLKVLVIRDGSILWQNDFEITAHQYVIAATLHIKEVESVRAKRDLVMKAAVRMKEEACEDLERFFCLLDEEAKRYLERPVQDYHIVFPLNVHPRCFAKRRWFNVLGMRLSVHTGKYVEKRFAVSEWYTEAKLWRPNLQVYISTPIVCTVAGRDVNEAFAKANEAFDLLRVFLNLPGHLHVFKQQFGGLPTPLSTILPPPVYGAFKADGSYEAIFVNNEPLAQYRTEQISVDCIQATVQRLRLLKMPRDANDTMGVIIEAHKKYGEALDTTDWRTAFLNLWQALEIMTFRSVGKFNMENVLKRAESLLFSNPLLTDLLNIAHEDRNTLVHRGKFSDNGMDDVSMLKAVVEHCLIVILSLYKTCPTWQKLEYFYKHGLTMPGELKEEIGVARFIHKNKLKNVSKSA